ncbi:hypothetical protein HBH92_043420 [Parastagonospora nodorum]|nr:hypothetical protein HBH92_043420 [Parastagonospora nodorum]
MSNTSTLNKADNNRSSDIGREVKTLTLGSSALNKYSKKHLKVREADALKQVDANVREGENKNYSSLYYFDKLEAQLRKVSKEEELAKTKKEKREKEAQKREAELDSLLDSDNYCLDSSLDINSKNNSENEEATIAKDLNERQSLYKSRDSNRTLYSRRLIDAYILYFKELLSNNSRIFANAIGIGKTRAIVLAVLIEYVYFKN